MSERDWAALVASGLQARHQAVEILRRPRGAWEWAVPETLRLHRWALAVLAGAPPQAARGRPTDGRQGPS